MKKSKLLLATPLMLAPVVATFPVVASCSKKSDVTLTGDFAKNVNIETFGEPLIIGEPYVISLSIKQDQVGKQYLPNSLKTVKSGDVELWLYEEYEMSNGIYDYYQYVPYANNTRAYLYINNVSGKISIEAVTSELDHITATPMLTNLSENVEYEVGETANTAGRILATGTLKNDDIIILTEYSITLDGYSSDYTFATVDIDTTKDGKKGTISYNGLTSKEFTFKVLAKTFAYLTDETKGETAKFATLKEAIAKYNNITTIGGEYIISIAPGEYEIAETLSITETANDLLIKPLYWLENEYEPNEYWVQLNRTGVTQSGSVLFSIDGAPSSVGSVTIMGIQFNEPDCGTGTGWDYSHILIGNSTQNITIGVCDFEGDATNTNNIYAVKTVVGQSTSNISIVDCEGEYLENLFNGSIGHVVGSRPDLQISYCSIDNCKHLFNVHGSAIQASIYRTYAGIMWDANETETVDNGGLTICGSGTYLFDTCLLTQINNLTNNNGFVNIDTPSSPDSLTKELIFEYCWFNRGENETKIYDVYNKTNTPGQNWAISWTDAQKTERDTVYGVESASHLQHVYWDHTPII